jgi:excisionase family DNA binding protein
MNDPKLLTERELAEFLSVSPRTLQKMRQRGSRLAFVKFESKVLYRREDVQSYLSQHVHYSTSEYSIP